MFQTTTAPAGTPELVQLEPRNAAIMRVSGDASELPSLLPKAFEATMERIAGSGGQVAGPPFARYLAFGGRIEAEVGFPYIGSLIPTDEVHDTTLPGGRAVLYTHVGPYGTIGQAWELVRRWIGDQGLKTSSAPWESYLTGPDEPGEPVTQIVFPVR